MRLAPDPAADLQAVQLRHHPVQHQQVRALLLDGQHGLGAVVRLDHAVPLVFEVPPHQGVQIALVFGHYDRRHVNLCALAAP